MGQVGSETRAGNLLELPPEIFLMIVGLLWCDGIQYNWLTLSRVSRALRKLLAPRVFESVVLTNTDCSGDSLQAIMDSQNADYVRQLHYKGIIPRQSEHNYEQNGSGFGVQRTSPIPFPSSVQSTLSQLKRLCNLRKMVVEFPFRWADLIDPILYDPITFRVSILYDRLGVQEAEEKNSWRALMRQTFDALSLNDGAVSLHLELRRLAPVPVSSFETPAFQRFLQRLTGFTLSLRGSDHEMPLELTAMLFPKDFIARLGLWFFENMENTQTLTWQALGTDPIYSRASDCVLPLALKPDQMPFLRSIRVRYLFTSLGLSNFINAHAKSLEEIVMIDCLASGPSPDVMRWCDFFHAISEAKPAKLRKLEIVRIGNQPGGDPMEREDREPSIEEVTNGTWNLQADERHLMLHIDSELRTSCYGDLDDKFRYIDSSDEEENYEEDKRAYNQLIDLVNHNRSNHISTDDGSNTAADYTMESK